VLHAVAGTRREGLRGGERRRGTGHCRCVPGIGNVRAGEEDGEGRRSTTIPGIYLAGFVVGSDNPTPPVIRPTPTRTARLHYSIAPAGSDSSSAGWAHTCAWPYLVLGSLCPAGVRTPNPTPSENKSRQRLCFFFI
jgi:hypothetical protein